MGVTVATTRVACTVDTAPYTQDITTADLGGLTPVAALFIATYATADDTAAAHGQLSFGAATGASNEWSFCMSTEDAQSTTDTEAEEDAAACVHIILPGTVGDDGEAEFSAWITNGVRINWTNAPAGAYLLTVVFFAGTDVSAHADVVALGNSEDNAVDITAPGFQPDLVIAGFARNAGSQLSGSYGFATSSAQRGYGMMDRGNVATSTAFAASTDDGIVIEVNWAAIDWWGEVGSFDANGFTVTTRNAGANDRNLGYLALNFNSAATAWVGTHTTPTSVNGDTADTGPSFTPQFVMMIQNYTEAFDTYYSDGRAGTFGFSCIDADEQYADTISFEDAQGTTNTQSLSDDQSVSIPQHDGTIGIEGTHVSFDATGWTTTYTAVEGTAKLFLALAIEEESAETTYTVTAAMYAIFQETATVSVPARAVLMETPSRTAAGRAMLQEAVSATAAGLATLKEAVDKTAAGHAVITMATSVTAAGQASLKEAYSVIAGAYATLKEAVSNTAAGQAVIKMTASATAAMAAYLQDIGAVTVTRAMHAVIKMATGVTTATQAVLREVYSVTAATYATLQEAVSNTVAGQAVIKMATSVTAAGRAVLKEAYSATAGAYASLKEAVSNTTAGRAVIKMATSATAAMAAYLQDTGVITVVRALRAVLKEAYSKTVACYARLQDTTVAEADLDAQPRTFSLDAQVRTFSLDAQPRSFDVTAEKR